LRNKERKSKKWHKALIYASVCVGD